MEDFFSNARAYANAGYAVFPLSPGTKVPAIKGGSGVKQATRDASMIAAWARRYPNANIGIACGEASGIIVIDIDPRNGANKSLADLAARGYVFPECPTAETGGGGRHLFFRHEPRLGNSKDKLGRGIDVKSTGGYVVAAPSVVTPSASGGTGRYSWIKPPDEFELVRLPLWVRQRLSPPPPPVAKPPDVAAPQSIRGLIDFLHRAGQGERNNRLYWAAMRAAEMVRSHHVSESGAVAQLMAAAVAIGLPAKESQATIQSAFKSDRG